MSQTIMKYDTDKRPYYNYFPKCKNKNKYKTWQNQK